MTDIQKAAKERVNEIMKDYDVAYIDYSAFDDEYVIRLEKPEEKEEK
ncbi:hypothetical protein SAMN05421503_2486 [Terribacillus aidingensis]|uniref:Uncharacterized protein n=1 Tax=Terribacillus aidingensis TaxID=586416 RepID=A0A285NYK4_9BACI|nr:hypothetical protein [Terribacillus aidingensis]SNZ14564.1 hypothetical protein SAMN05421503_2486 [Terribacillus aidingensis]